jgi:DNA-binding NtrC family response regulator
MFTAKQFRAKAKESAESLKHTDVPSEIRELQRSKESFTALAENEDWLANNFDKIIRSQDIHSSDDGVAHETAAETEAFFDASARPSSCNGRRSRRSYSANSSIPQARWGMC